MLQRNQHRFSDRGAGKQKAKLLVREIPARIHIVQVGAARYRLQALLLLLIKVLLTPQAHPAALLCNDALLLAFRKRRQGGWVPRRHFDAARGHPKLTTAPQLQLHPRIARIVSRMERREALVAPLAPEHHHARRDRMHRPRRLQPILSKHYVELRHAQRHPVDRHKHHVPVQARVCQPLFQLRVALFQHCYRILCVPQIFLHPL